MLSKDQFIKKHKVRFDALKLTAIERDKRYQDYKSSSAGTRTAVVRPSTSMIEPERGLSKCSMYYAQSLTDPWNVPEPPCIPDTIVLPSFKYAARARSIMTIGTLGVGVVACDPWNGAIGDIPAVYATTAAYNTALYDPNLFVSPTGNAIYSDSTQIVTTFNNNRCSVRLVGCGVRVRYIGTELNRSGRLVIARHPTNGDWPTGWSVANFLQDKETVTVPVDRSWHSVVFRPAVANDLVYQGNPTWIATRELSLVILADGCVPGITFELDYCAWFEEVGLNLPALTRSTSDPLGLSVVQSSMSIHQPTTSPSANFQSLMKIVGGVASEALSFVAPHTRKRFNDTIQLTKMLL